MTGLSVDLADGSPPVLHIGGEIDIATAEQLRNALGTSLSTHPALVVDMADVTFIDGSGLRVILQVADGRCAHGPLRLVNAPGVARLLDLVGLADLDSVDVHPGRERA